MANKGFLLVTMQPPPALEEEFNAWYDTEHIPERAAIPGFETALRFVCLSGFPRYLAMYDLARQEVLETADYLRVAYERSSPWTKRNRGPSHAAWGLCPYSAMRTMTCAWPCGCMVPPITPKLITGAPSLVTNPGMMVW